jgi:RimJ/RimL family protein N-acetyltransferase
VQVHVRTERLILRQFTESDADDLVALDSDPAVLRFINGGQPIAATITRTETLPRFLAWHRHSADWGYWAAIEAESGRFLGWFHLRPSSIYATADEVVALGYRLRRDAWGQGFATEGARALILKGFEQPLIDRIVAMAVVENAASIAVMRRAGLRFVRDFVYDGPDPTAWHVGRPAVEYGVTRAEYGAERDADG